MSSRVACATMRTDEKGRGVTMPAAAIELHPDVRGHLGSAVRRAANTVGRQIEAAAVAFLDRHALESPAEQIFAAWFFALERTLMHRFELMPQHDVIAGGRRYRLDFRVLPADALELHEAAIHRLSLPLVAVEIDGHEWHERTRQQVTSRDRRDRDLQAAGWQVLHFSGGEVVTQPDRCVAEVLRAVYQPWTQLLEILGRRKRLGAVARSR